MWFGLPVFLFYLCLSVNKAAAPNWDALAFLGFGLLAIYYWRERLESSAVLRLGAADRDIVGLTMSMFALDTDLLSVVGSSYSEAIQATGCAVGKPLQARWRQCAIISRRNWGRNFFLLPMPRPRLGDFLLPAQQAQRGPGIRRFNSRVPGHGESILILAALR